jgi:hypothetical protein
MLSVLFFGFLQFLHASDLDKSCSYFHESGPGLQYYRQFFKPNSCYLDLQPTQYENMKYRGFLFSNKGLFMVFNSFNESDNSSATGARVFYFFPRKNNPDRKVDNSNLIISSAAPWVEFSFDLNNGNLIQISANGKIADIKVDKKISPDNAGGVEILKFAGLRLDLGFALGYDPALEKYRDVQFIDQNENSCTVENQEIFNYINNGDYEFKHSTDSELKIFLQKRCPNLTLSTLE